LIEKKRIKNLVFIYKKSYNNITSSLIGVYKLNIWKPTLLHNRWLFPKNIDNLTGTQFLIKITYLVIMKKSRTGQHCSIYTSQPASVIKGETN
jgi:hypothetical protein